ncbi:MAG: sigma-54 dependent transcriptional regulator [Desulfobacterales bacterium]
MDERILVVDDDWDFLELMKARLRGAGFKQVKIEDDPLKAAALFESEEPFDIALIDMTMPELDGLQLLDMIKNNSPRTECIIVTAVNDARVAVQCLRKGAYDYLVKPISEEDLVFSLKRTLEKRRLLEILDLEKSHRLPTLSNPEAFKSITTRSPRMLRLLREAELHARSDVPILITGESGTGKELLARAIHAVSPRARYPFMPVNMAAISASLFEAEFFGHTRGAFTGAEKERDGYLKNAHHGTLFLDEIGTLPPAMQVKLLRVLQDGEYTKLGSSASHKVDARVVAATNEDLEQMISAKTFRKDLYYRIRGGWLHLLPLRERKEDIPLLVDLFLKEYCAPSSSCGIDQAAMCLLAEYHFPGNIRELKSIVQSAVNLAQGKPISADELPQQLRRPRVPSACDQIVNAGNLASLAEVEKTHILDVYRQLNDNKSQTARILGIGLNTLRRKLTAYGVTIS